MLEAEAIIIEAEAKDFADGKQHHEIQKNGERVVLKGGAIREITEGAGPAGGEQDDEQGEAQGEVQNAQPALDAVIAGCAG